MRDIKCGEIFCENCGDCYVCEYEFPCYGRGEEGEHSFDFSSINEEENDGSDNS